MDSSIVFVQTAFTVLIIASKWFCGRVLLVAAFVAAIFISVVASPTISPIDAVGGAHGQNAEIDTVILFSQDAIIREDERGGLTSL